MKPKGWQTIELESGVAFAVPPDAQQAGGTAVDSAAGIFDGDGYRITFDLGRFGERLDALRHEQSFRSQSRGVAGSWGTEVAFAPSDEPFAWARIFQLDLGSGLTFTVRVSCVSVERCKLADAVFDSIAVNR